MKKIFILFLSCMAFAASAQLHLPFANNNISAGLSEVIKDYPNHFSHIKGEIIIRDVQSTDYTCKVQVAGAASIVTMHGEDKEDVYSWKAVLLQTDDFEKAKARYRQIYSQVKATKAIIDGQNFALHAEYESPDESKNFTSIIFNLQPAGELLKNLVADLSINYSGDGWQITLSVYEHNDYGVNAKTE